jgi:hypothetical protein
MSNLTVTLLRVVLVISVLLSLVFFWGGISKERQLRELRPQAALVNNNLGLMNSLANDVAEYSKKNPAIIPIMESANLRTAKPAATAVSRPGTK